MPQSEKQKAWLSWSLYASQRVRIAKPCRYGRRKLRTVKRKDSDALRLAPLLDWRSDDE